MIYTQPHRRSTVRVPCNLQCVEDLLATERPADPFADWLDERPQGTEQLDALWEMTTAQRVCAMRRGELSADQLAAWAALDPDQVPRIAGVPEWLADVPAAAVFR